MRVRFLIAVLVVAGLVAGTVWGGIRVLWWMLGPLASFYVALIEGQIRKTWHLTVSSLRSERRLAALADSPFFPEMLISTDPRVAVALSEPRLLPTAVPLLLRSSERAYKRLSLALVIPLLSILGATLLVGFWLTAACALMAMFGFMSPLGSSGVKEATKDLAAMIYLLGCWYERDPESCQEVAGGSEVFAPMYRAVIGPRSQIENREQPQPSCTEEQRNIARTLVSVAAIGNTGSHDVVQGVCPGAEDLLVRHCVAERAWYPAWVYFTTIATVGAAYGAALQRCCSAEEGAALPYAIQDALCDWEQRPWLPTAGGDKRPWDGCPGAHDYFLDYSRFMTSQPAKTRDELALAIGIWVWGNLTNATSDELKRLCSPKLLVVTGQLILRLSADVVEATFAE
jgi:hypothetical protein